MKKLINTTIRGEFELLPIERKQKVNKLKDEINLSYKDIYNYASDISKNMSNFSVSIQKLLSRKDISNIDKMMEELTSKISKIDTKKILKGNPSLKEIKEFIEDYNEVSSDLVKVKSAMKTIILELQKDIELCNRYLEQNLEYVTILDDYILAGRIKIEEVEEELSLINSLSDDLDKELIVKKRTDLEQLVHKVEDLATLRLIAVQNVPMIGIIQQGDYTLIEKMNESINRTLPVWETQAIVAIAVAYQKSGITSYNSIEETLAKSMKINTSLIKKNALEMARDIDTNKLSVKTLYSGTKDAINAINILKNTKINTKDKRKIDKQIEENEKIGKSMC